MDTMSTGQRFIYFFGDGQAEGSSDIKHLVGGKGASLADMTRAQLNVPPGFTISAECCDLYYTVGRHWPDGLDPEVRTNLARLEQLAGRPFGQGDNPLLVAVRSGAAQSMPGMMDTVLNVGLNPACVRGMAQRTGNHRGAWEAYRHFLVMFGHTVGDVDEAVFTGLIADMLKETGKSAEAELDAEQMEELCYRFMAAYRQHTGKEMPTDPWAMLCAAIDAVFGSWNNERAITYRKHHKINGLLGTAVNVQMMCPSEVSGVLFTANPVNHRIEDIVIQSSFGLGEAIVLGKVDPDTFVVDRKSLAVKERKITVKRHIVATLAQDGHGQSGSNSSASLTDPQIKELVQLGLRVEEYFKRPSDIEWALSQGRFYLLQARGIKGLADGKVTDAGEREYVRQEEIAALQKLAEPGGTVWARFNLSEILPEPTPMTWAIVRRFMSGQGGFGLMYRDLGFDPDPGLDEQGIFDLVCGRPYCNLSREPRMQFRRLPFEHSFVRLKKTPSAALYPQPTLNPVRGGITFLLQLPAIALQMVRSGLKMRAEAKVCASRLRQEVIPAFAKDVAQQAAADLSKLDPPALLQRLETWIRRTLYDYAREGLRATALAGVSMGNLERGLKKAMRPPAPSIIATPEDIARAQSATATKVRSALGQLIMGVRPDAEADLPSAVHDLAAGHLKRAEFLERFGHRGPREMELSQPRWAEDPSSLDHLVHHGSSGLSHDRVMSDRESTSFRQRVQAEVRKILAQKPALELEIANLQTFLALRETAKHYLMKGYAEIRRILVELDRRYNLAGGIFYLTPDELPRLIKGEDLTALIAQRKERRAVALSLEAPQVLFSDDLQAIGRPMTVASAATLQGVPLSAGIAEGPALVLQEPGDAPPSAEAYILVCPTTDPAWVPLFVQAKALVMETGGVLSHGAIVAREFGLPAVAGLPDVYRRIKTGQRLRVDGGTGAVAVLS
jgi:phosphohistidine swiveling domain-containing protein